MPSMHAVHVGHALGLGPQHQPDGRLDHHLEEDRAHGATVGKRVRVTGLVKLPALNGACGVVDRFDARSDRYHVIVDADPTHGDKPHGYMLKPSNVELVAPQPGEEQHPQRSGPAADAPVAVASSAVDAAWAEASADANAAAATTSSDRDAI